ncbi:MAG: cytochrome c [Mizugakiibacter sp.]|uniref:c-type cytochrome n=1 Tax=Mizugakiibacter sp. TaxID=1972610 RepID=UPI0031C93927|nr:cytochrome c [Xanthomonadaceae bacterium]
MNRVLTLVSVAAALALSAPAFAKGNPDDGQKKAAACFACHGADGNATDPQYPRLAGQYADYLEQALHEYKNGNRKNPIMVGFAATLSEQDIQDVAAYFSGLPAKVHDLHGVVAGN